jgi:diacylglycerol kinase family enzyme
MSSNDAFRSFVIVNPASAAGADFGRTIGQADLESACVRLRGRKTRSIDVGLAHFAGHDGVSTTRIFVNVASFGCSGLVAHLVSPRLKALSGQLAFTLATLRALTIYRDQTVTVEFDDMPPRSLAITDCAFGNGEGVIRTAWIWNFEDFRKRASHPRDRLKRSVRRL